MIIAPSLPLSGHCNKLRLKEWNGSLWLHLASNILHIEWNYIFHLFVNIQIPRKPNRTRRRIVISRKRGRSDRSPTTWLSIAYLIPIITSNHSLILIWSTPIDLCKQFLGSHVTSTHSSLIAQRANPSQIGNWLSYLEFLSRSDPRRSSSAF